MTLIELKIFTLQHRLSCDALSFLSTERNLRQPPNSNRQQMHYASCSSLFASPTLGCGKRFFMPAENSVRSKKWMTEWLLTRWYGFRRVMLMVRWEDEIDAILMEAAYKVSVASVAWMQNFGKCSRADSSFFIPEHCKPTSSAFWIYEYLRQTWRFTMRHLPSSRRKFEFPDGKARRWHEGMESFWTSWRRLTNQKFHRS